MKMPMTRLRPIRTSDGAGGVTTSYDAGAIIWGNVEVNANEVTVSNVDVIEDVQVGDEIEISE